MIDSKQEWHEFKEPIPLGDYDLHPGTQIRVRYTSGLASNPTVVTEDLLIGDINSLGGFCDDCSLGHEADCVILAERVLI